ncbi:type II secretion system protein GspM [Hyphomicrobium sp.]|uniref:type II secretion system protein GspM n=1 Tax=Hyphomicrobium sp. TaxID=82 RepID=UPI0013218178|nr:type II secretion system protein GspM [Hyphomicrobium sp.]KAB2936990.1 MAG: hypothetical protein F9K20_20680 [Hyphomicrobium sp.]
MEQLPLVVRRLIALAILFAIATIAGSLLSLGLWGLKENADRIDLDRKQLGRYLAIVRSRSENAVGTAERDTKGNADASLFWSGESEAIILAALQSKVQAIAGSHGAQFRSVRPLPKRQTGHLELAGLSLDVTAEIGSLQRAIGDIETHSPPLIIMGAQMRRSQYTQSASAPTEIKIDAQIEVYGAFRAVPKR